MDKFTHKTRDFFINKVYKIIEILEFILIFVNSIEFAFYVNVDEIYTSNFERQ